jgi:phosphoribosylanthranilate isomerase
LPPLVSSIGIFANASLETFSDIEEVCPTTHSQLQGSEDESLVRECGPGVIKAVRYDGDGGVLQREVERWSRIDEVDAILIVLPAPAAEPGFDFAALVPLLRGVQKPVLLSGLSAVTVADAVRQLRPFAVEVAVAAEAPGEPHPSVVEAFCSAVRQADGSQAS